MRIGVLVKNELIKARYRAAFWVTLLIMTAIVALAFGESWYGALTNEARTFALPDAWPNIFGNTGPLPAIFSSAALIMLVAAEFTYRTSRQNVIDGLSKREFFVGKLLLCPILGAVFLGTMTVIGAGFALAGTNLGEIDAIIRLNDLKLLFGTSLLVLGYSSMAFFAAISRRASGPAMGFFFLYVAFVEQLLGGLLGRFEEWGTKVAEYLPRGVFDRLGQSTLWDAEARQQAVARAVEAGREVPEFATVLGTLMPAVGWIMIFLGTAFLIFDRRDL